MKKIKLLTIFIILLFNISASKAAESIVAGVDGMFCLACQEKLTKAFNDKFGSEVIITVSWEKGLAVVSVPTKGKITEEDFKNVVLETGFKFEGVKTVGKPLNSLRETEVFIEQNPGLLILKTF
jgi:hypothetical protein